jgi:hypothetical protein
MVNAAEVRAMSHRGLRCGPNGPAVNGMGLRCPDVVIGLRLPSGGVLELFDIEAHRSDVPLSLLEDCGLLGVALRNQHIASVMVFPVCGNIHFTAAVHTSRGKPTRPRPGPR